MLYVLTHQGRHQASTEHIKRIQLHFQIWGLFLLPIVSHVMWHFKSVHLSTCQSFCLYFYLSVYMSVTYVSVYLTVYISTSPCLICLPVNLPLCLTDWLPASLQILDCYTEDVDEVLVAFRCICIYKSWSLSLQCSGFFFFNCM